LPVQAEVSASIDPPEAAAKRSVTLEKIRDVYSNFRAKLGREKENISLEGLIDMYGIPREEVIGVLVGASGKILHVDEFNSAGPEWLSFRYWVTKS
jgi:hypothetical protein